MKITIICVGKLKERHWKEACQDYLLRLRPYCQMELIELADEPIVENASPAQEEAVKNKEGKKILSKLPQGAYVVSFDGHGKEVDSPGFAAFLESGFVRGGSHIVFLIGGSLGLSDEVKQKADASIRFGAMTFPHNLARVMALEQIYRAFRILRHEPYHK